MPSGFYDNAGTGSPTGSWVTGIHTRHTNTANQYGHDIFGSMFGPELYHRELNNGGLGTWKKVANSARGYYVGNGTDGRHFALGFMPFRVLIWNRNWAYWHEGFWTDGLDSQHYGWYYDQPGYQTTNNGYRPYIQYDGFDVNNSILNNNGTGYEWWAIG